ncbi:hypothetical protein NIES25_29910 [Nostoc linckia NIES-25]|nr:hypothetical protein NIES25_29910 [Nostoc linckia NIES-25]
MKKSYLVYSSLAIFNLTIVAAIPIKNTFAQEIPKAQCISNFGQNACGYNCIANFGQVKCADWPGGACIANFGQVVCGPPAPPNWASGYTNNSNSNNGNSGVYGAWVVKNGDWNGILRMQGNSGRMILVSNRGAAVEQKMTLNVNPQGGYILDGEVLTQYVRGRYNADNFYIQQFSKDSINVNNCDDNSQCNSVTLVYLGK